MKNKRRIIMANKLETNLTRIAILMLAQDNNRLKRENRSRKIRRRRRLSLIPRKRLSKIRTLESLAEMLARL